MSTPNSSTPCAGDEVAGNPITRRRFLQTTSLAAGGVALGGLSVERAAFAQGSDTVKIALVGCGGRGSGAAAQALSTEGNVKLVAMADGFAERLGGSYNNLVEKHKEKMEITCGQTSSGVDG